MQLVQRAMRLALQDVPVVPRQEYIIKDSALVISEL